MADVHTSIHTHKGERVEVQFEDHPTFKCVTIRVGSQKVLVFGDRETLRAFRDAVPIAYEGMLRDAAERESEEAAERDGGEEPTPDGEEQDRRGDEERDARIADGRMR